MKRILYVVLIIIAVLCMSLKSEKGSSVDSLEILQIKNENLLPILDSIVSHEKLCVYYTPDLYFSIRSLILNDTITEFQVGAFGSMLIEFGDNNYKGCFKHKGHWFFVEGQELNKALFAKTNQKKAFVFYKPAWETNNGEIILRVIEDDIFSFWIYYYVNNKLIFREMYDPYCKNQCN